MNIEKILGRKQYPELLGDFDFSGKTVLITGAGGSVGTRLTQRLVGCKVYPTDKDNMDITNQLAVSIMMSKAKPDIVIHLAGMKHAPQGEVNPQEAIV